MSSMQRTLDDLRDLGYEPAVVERFNRHAGEHGRFFDLYGLADVEAIADDHTLYVQVCRVDDLTDHIGKAQRMLLPRLKRDPRPPRTALEALLASPARRFEIWSWGKRGRSWVARRWRAIDARSFAVVPFETAPNPLREEVSV